jgi:PAS domain S-box-containing protein
MRILIVDDELVSREKLRKIMDTFGQCVVVESGEDALQVATSQDPPGLILLDIIMPGMDGYEVCKRLKANRRTSNIPVIFISARSAEDDEAEGLGLGAVDYITKPFSPSIVEARVRTHLELKKHRNRLEELVNERTVELKKATKEMQTEIAERKQIEEDLRTSEEKYRSLVETTSDWIWEVDNEGVYTYTNSKIMDILGYEPGEIIGKTPFDFMAPNDQKRLTEWFRDILESCKSFEGLENTNIHKDGRHVLLETSGVPIFDTDENLLGYRGIDRDITRRKLAEETLQKRTNTLAERVKELNCLYGISDLVDKPGVSLDEILQGVVDLIPLSWQYPEVTCSRIIMKDKEVRSRNFQESVWKQAQNIVVYGKTIGTLEVFYFEERPEHDEGPFLTEERLLINAVAERLGKTIERRQAKEALQKAHNELERRVEERTAELMSANEKLNHEIEVRKQVEEGLKESTKKIKLFAYSVSHDLKSPAIGIYGLTKRLSRLYGRILDEKGKTYCDQILKASEQIAGLAENINVYMSTKEAPITIETVNLKEFLRMVREEIAPQLIIRKVKWSQPDYLPEIKADKLSIVRVIRNLVDNALKYGGDDLSEISIGYQESDEFHILSVMDDGIGLKAGDSKDIFDIFKRTKTSRGIEGAGLGLAIAKEIAERHAGKIWMKPGTEKGIEFRVSISKHLRLSH